MEHAQALLGQHRLALDTLANRLLDQETVDGTAAEEALKTEAAAAGTAPPQEV